MEGRRAIGSVGRVCLWAVAAGIVVGTLVGYAGGMFWIFDLIASFRPQLLALGALVAVGAVVLAAHDRRLGEVVGALVVVGCVALNALAVIPLWTGRPEAPDGGVC